ncbi:arsenite methyltransferase-like [Babylonia areolata]|uniref:arsenite methyltransferase-like n=1 Tax=Babylonia areolata TaxID=304850 RepID=UPI003FD4AD4D
MAELPIFDKVREVFNKLNVETDITSRCNHEQLTEQQTECFQQLSKEIKKRYWGSGLNIPENLTGKRVLDIGCGSGSLVFILSKLVGPTGYVVGFDLTEGPIKTAQEQSDYHCKLWGYDKPNFEFRVLNAENLDEAGFSPGEFDIIV